MYGSSLNTIDIFGTMSWISLEINFIDPLIKALSPSKLKGQKSFPWRQCQAYNLMYYVHKRMDCYWFYLSQQNENIFK